jgi:hypothetical protein
VIDSWTALRATGQQQLAHRRRRGGSVLTPLAAA